jgi:hypothetical protein
LVFPWLVYNQFAFGTIVQTSGATFPWLAHRQYINEYGSYFNWALIPYALKTGFYSFALYAFHYGNWILTALAGFTLVYRLKVEPARFKPLWWAVAGAALFVSVHILVRWSVRPWYAQTAFVLTFPAVALAMEGVSRYLLGLGAAAALYFASLPAWSPAYFRRVDQFRGMLEAGRALPLRDRVGSFNCGYLQYFADRKVINLDGFVNNEVLNYYKKNAGLEYLRRENIRWLVDYYPYLISVFGPYFGPEAEQSLYVRGIKEDRYFPKNSSAIIEVLPEGESPPAGRELPISREAHSRRQWGPFPWPVFKRI